MTDAVAGPLAPRLGRLAGVLLILGVLAFLGWQAARVNLDGERLLEREFAALGAQIQVSVVLDPGFPHARGDKTLGQVEDLMHELDRRWAPWGGGDLGELNRRLAAGEEAQVAESLRPLFDAGAWLSAASGGVFDPRAGRLSQLWGFDDAAHLRTRPPPETSVQQLTADLQAAPALGEGLERYGPAPAVQFDFGGVARGYAVDLAIALLKRAGIGNAIVNAGFALHSTGVRGQHPWRVGIRPPKADALHRVLATLRAAPDEAVITRGVDERSFEFEGRRYHGLLDPRTGAPAQGLQAVTVVHAQGAVADAAGTALMIAGPEGWRALARRIGVSQVLVVDARGRVFVTEELFRRLEFERGIKPRVVP